VSRLLVVAGTASGVGKTSVTLGLLTAFRRRGLTVQAFQAGPDFIDPAFHALVTEPPSYNLDGWMCGREQVLATGGRAGADADLCIVEGVMGLHDGVDGVSKDGSTAPARAFVDACAS
jgi:cobyrinic acid a,c-diamide synthase